jgi:hypothetical protein
MNNVIPHPELTDMYHVSSDPIFGKPLATSRPLDLK